MSEDRTSKAFSNLCIRFGCVEFDILNEPSDMGI